MSIASFITCKPLRYTVLLVWVLMIFWLSLDPAPPTPEPKILGWDKILHAIAYGCLTLFGGWTLTGSVPLPKSIWVAIAGAAVLLGGCMELFQKTLTETRTAEFADFLANACGAGIILLGIFIKKEYTRRHLNNHRKSSAAAGSR
jgi:VanZ family protein